MSCSVSGRGKIVQFPRVLDVDLPLSSGRLTARVVVGPQESAASVCRRTAGDPALVSPGVQGAPFLCQELLV